MGVGDVIQDNRVMWLCRIYLKAGVAMGGCVGYVSRLGQS